MVAFVVVVVVFSYLFLIFSSLLFERKKVFIQNGFFSRNQILDVPYEHSNSTPFKKTLNILHRNVPRCEDIYIVFSIEIKLHFDLIL